jgi:hypothetical protein
MLGNQHATRSTGLALRAQVPAPELGTASISLRYFDLTSERIHKVRAKSLYVSRDPFTGYVEKWLGRAIESPAGDYVARAKKARAATVPDPPTPTRREWQL